jgi:hypothetical protein
MARSTVRRWKTHKVFDYFEGVHDGYAPIEHRRHVLTRQGDLIVVADLVSGSGTHTASVHWHVDPRWRVAVRESMVTFSTTDAQCQLASPRGHIERFDGDARTGLGWRAPLYGNLEPSTSLRVTHTGALPFWMVSVFGLNRENAVVDVEFMPVSAEAGALTKSLALRIVRHSSIDVVALAESSAPSGRSGHGPDTKRVWRTGDIEADARVLYCREQDGRLGDVFLLDGSRVRVNADPPLEFDTPHRMEYVHLTTDNAPVPVAAPPVASGFSRTSA